MNARDLPFPAKFRDALGGGIDYSLPGNGGPDCRDHVSFQHRMWETGAALGLAFLAILLSNRSSKQQARGERRGSSASRTQPPPPPSTSRRLLLVILTFTYGLEVGFKLATRQLIFLLNPCHVLTVINIYILSSGGGPMAQTLHLRTLHYLHGPILALLLPVTNTLFLPFEAETYWIQHILIVVVPIYLLVTNPEYRSQDPMSLSSICLSYALWVGYHMAIMNWLSVWTLANIGSMLCPAITDPFPPSLYRLHGLWHQVLAIGLMGALGKGLGRITETNKEH